MPVVAIRAFLGGPFGIVEDVEMLIFLRDLSTAGGIVLAIVVIVSVLIQNFWRRYLYPYGALMGIVSLASPLRIRRNPQACIDRAKCSDVRAAGRSSHRDPLG